MGVIGVHFQAKWSNHMRPTIFFDTNVFRYFATAFRDSPLDEDLTHYLAVSPISLLELLGQLATPGAQEAFDAIQTMFKVFRPEHTVMLPWEDEVFRVIVFGVQPTQQRVTDALSNATHKVFNASSPNELQAESQELHTMLIQAKYQAAEDFAQALNSWRKDGAPDDILHRRFFAEGIARRADVPVKDIDAEDVTKKLCALWAYESTRLENAASEPNYNPHRNENENDAFDAEQLVYLAIEEAHFLTADSGFRKASTTVQYPRIHLEPVQTFTDHKLATQLIRSIVEASRS
jgi:hypothetical protein